MAQTPDALKLLTACPRLRHLDFTHLWPIADLVTTCPPPIYRLASLSLGRLKCHVNADDLAWFFGDSGTTLRVLALSGTVPLSADGSRALARLAPGLQDVDIHFTPDVEEDVGDLFAVATAPNVRRVGLTMSNCEGEFSEDEWGGAKAQALDAMRLLDGHARANIDLQLVAAGESRYQTQEWESHSSASSSGYDSDGSD